MLIINDYKKIRKCAIKIKNTDKWVGIDLIKNDYFFLFTTTEHHRIIFKSYDETIKYLNENIIKYNRNKKFPIKGVFNVIDIKFDGLFYFDLFYDDIKKTKYEIVLLDD